MFKKKRPYRWVQLFFLHISKSDPKIGPILEVRDRLFCSIEEGTNDIAC